jgi:hypothetical protein
MGQQLALTPWRISRGFLAALAGIAMTLFAWYGPWAWPAWPAFTLIDLAFGSNTAFAELPFAARAATVTALIIVNATFWAVAAWIPMRALRR